MTDRIKGKVAIVTGSTQGIGAVSPGLILTENTRKWFNESPDPQALEASQTAILPTKRIGEPREVAYTALFLASDEARFINATDILIDGGRSALYHE